MRKRNIKKIADTIFWYAIYMLPLILTIIQSFGLFTNFGYEGWLDIYNNFNLQDFEFLDLLENNLIALGISFDGLITITLSSIFGDVGILRFVDSDIIFGFCEWFVCTMLVHLCVDFILFIPRLAHKWMDTLTKED